MSEKAAPFFILYGTVVHGKGLGRTVGLPTANIAFTPPLPAFLKKGVYATIIDIDGERFLSVTNVGTRPSVDSDANITVEANILDFDRDIYGKEVKLEFYKFLRDVQKFNSLLDVKKQVDKDKKEVRASLSF